MSNPLLVAVANASPYTAVLTSTNNGGGDNSQFAPWTVGFTGGSDQNNIQIPECSGSQYYAGNHILVTGQDQSGNTMWTCAIWANDQNNAILYWNNADAYSDANALGNTGGDSEISTLFIGFKPDGTMNVNANSYPS